MISTRRSLRAPVLDARIYHNETLSNAIAAFYTCHIFLALERRPKNSQIVILTEYIQNTR